MLLPIPMVPASALKDAASGCKCWNRTTSETIESRRARTADKGVPLRWEPSRGGDLFPHLYGDLPVAAVVSETAIPLGEDGVPIIPDGLAP